MENTLQGNIRALRKQRGLTQEQLAEAMGVTTGAVSKWEKGQSAPELGLLMGLADFFDLSVDALLGFSLRSNDRKHTAERLGRLKREKRLQEGAAEAEKALQKYPNDFRIVYESAELYQVMGIETKEAAHLKRAIALLERACLLIGQNTDETISELKLRIDMAKTYLVMGDNETGLRLLKQYNPCGISDDVIGLALSTDSKRAEEAETFLAEALIAGVNGLIRTAFGFANVFVRREQYAEAAALLAWMAGALPPGERGKVSYLDKVEATLRLNCAHMLLKTGEEKESLSQLTRARAAALRFDAAPDYSVSSVRWCERARPGTAFDDIGETAMEGIHNLLREIGDPALSQLWEDICHDGQ